MRPFEKHVQEYIDYHVGELMEILTWRREQKSRVRRTFSRSQLEMGYDTIPTEKPGPQPAPKASKKGQRHSRKIGVAR